MRNDLSGRRFGRLVVLERGLDYVSPKGSAKIRWNCVCDCGQRTTVLGVLLRNGKTKSCGCYQKECVAINGRSKRTHGHTHIQGVRTHSRTYMSWSGMRTRCMNPNCKDFRYYGALNVAVDPSWLGRLGFANFLNDMGPRPSGTTLDRIDPYGNYEPGNCRWADTLTQAHNKRRRLPHAK